MTKVSSDLEMTPQTRRENRSLSFSSHRQHGRLGGFEVFKDCHHPSPPRPLEIPAKAEAPALGSQLPLRPGVKTESFPCDAEGN